MRVFRWALVAILLVVLSVAIQQTLLWLGAWGNTGDTQVKPLDDGDQEIALIEPATSIDDWGRIVTAAQMVEKNWPTFNPTLPLLTVSTGDAFPLLTTDVPEIVFSFADAPERRLRLRWYKISGEHDATSWIHKLNLRTRPPLAIIGGGTSDRAVRLARALQKTYDNPEQPAPVLLITTATAEKTGSGKPLIDIYSGRSFRFSFTNQKMVEALLEFAQHREFPDKAKEWGAGNLWIHSPTDPQPPASAVSMHAVSWEDERYSTDMIALFDEEFSKRFSPRKFQNEGSIPFDVGGFFQPAPQEQLMVQTFLSRKVAPNSFLVLPTQTVRMRRFLINLRQRSEKDARNLVILNGDGIAFHSIYRDRDVMWSVLDLPFSLVFFAHRNPVDRSAGFRGPNDTGADAPEAFPPRGTSGTHDLLLYRDLLEAILYASHESSGWLDDPKRVRERLRATTWRRGTGPKHAPRVGNTEVNGTEGEPQPFFDAAGNRRSHTGEHIVWLKPSFTEDQVDLKSTISVWTIRNGARGNVWTLADSFPAYYNQSRLEGGLP